MSLFRKVTLDSKISGQLFLHSMPGRFELFEETCSELKRHKISTIVSLAPLGEIRQKSPRYAQAIDIGELPCEIRHLPIPDFQAPDDDKSFADEVDQTAVLLRMGKNVLIHCGAGIGRTGMFAIAVAVALGYGFNDAQSVVRTAGAGPERPSQEAALRRFLENRGLAAV